MNVLPISNLQSSMLERMDMQAKIATNPFNQLETNSNIKGTENNQIKIGSSLKGVLDVVNDHAQEADSKVRAVELGLSDDLIGATISAQKASLSFSALMQVRNKMVSNFDDIMKMAI